MVTTLTSHLHHPAETSKPERVPVLRDPDCTAALHRRHSDLTPNAITAGRAPSTPGRWGLLQRTKPCSGARSTHGPPNNRVLTWTVHSEARRSSSSLTYFAMNVAIILPRGADHVLSTCPMYFDGLFNQPKHCLFKTTSANRSTPEVDPPAFNRPPLWSWRHNWPRCRKLQ